MFFYDAFGEVEGVEEAFAEGVGAQWGVGIDALCGAVLLWWWIVLGLGDSPTAGHDQKRDDEWGVLWYQKLWHQSFWH